MLCNMPARTNIVHTLNQHTVHSYWESLKSKLSCGCLKYLEFVVFKFHKNITP